MSGPAPKIERSRALTSIHGVEYWLRFPSPHKPMGDTVWAHVYEPQGVENPPSLVYGHGLGVEIEMLEGASEESLNLLREGVSIVRIEAPWHNRRRPARSEAHTSELQSLMRITYAVLCLQKKKDNQPKSERPKQH